MILSWGIYFFISETRNDISLQSRQYLSEISQQKAEAIQKVITLNFDKLAAISQIISRSNHFDEESIMNILSAEAERSDYKRMGLATLDGSAVTTDHEKFNIFERDYFKKSINGEFGISDKIIDKVDEKPINVYSAPLYKDNQIYGVIFATFPTEFFTQIVYSPVFGQDGYTYIVTQSGAPVMYRKGSGAQSEFDNLFEEITLSDDDRTLMKDNMAAGKNGIIEYNINHEENIAAYCKIGINNWYLVSVVPKNLVSQSVNKIIYRNTEIAFIIAIVWFSLTAFIYLQQKKNAHHLERIAYFDELIGFPNYNSFLKNAQKILESNPNKQYAFAIIDVDNFKMINAQFGFETGNLVLRNMALAIHKSLSEADELFARIGIDEYIIMLEYKNEEYVRNTRIKFEQVFWDLWSEKFDYYIKFPTGRYISEKGEASITSIFEKVNYAHRKAKMLINEKNGLCEFLYDDQEKERTLRKIKIEKRMHTGIANKEFKVFLQPKYQLDTETIVGAEALVRWQNADGSIMSPGEFIPVFEQNGFIVKLDMYMFEEVCIIIKGWMEAESPLIPISVNVSRLHLLDPNFIKKIVLLTDTYQIPRQYIEIELTESVIFENEMLITDVLQEAHKYGFLLSMDDFGSGYSSLGLLKNLPVDVLKIDRSFFINNKYEGRAKTVIEVVITMAQRLQVKTVAEGIETAEQVAFLREIKCDIVQGYYFAKPMPLNEFNEKIKSEFVEHYG